MRHIRRWVYKMGFRPKAGSILFSPSHNLVFRLKDYNATQLKKRP